MESNPRTNRLLSALPERSLIELLGGAERVVLTDAPRADEILVAGSWDQRHLDKSGLTAEPTEAGPRYSSDAVRKVFQSQGIVV